MSKLQLGSVVLDSYEEAPTRAMPAVEVFTRNGATHDIIQTPYTSGQPGLTIARHACASASAASGIIDDLIGLVGTRFTVIAGGVTEQDMTLLPFNYAVQVVDGPKSHILTLALPLKAAGAAP
jgi:hypothetical protein